jgi:hypothetical protein
VHPLRDTSWGGNVAAQSPAEKQRLFREFLEWQQGQGEGKKQ